MNLLMCGGREWSDDKIVRAVLWGIYEIVDNQEEILTLIHGGARGADQAAGEAANTINSVVKGQLRRGLIDIKQFPAQWDAYGKSAGIIRNQQMLSEGNPTLVIAFHNDISASKGTKDMVDKAKSANIKVYNVRSL